MDKLLTLKQAAALANERGFCNLRGNAFTATGLRKLLSYGNYEELGAVKFGNTWGIDEKKWLAWCEDRRRN